MALSAGADLVLELPYPYSSSGAEFFASAAVRILSAAGVGTLCFGSECADIDALKRAASLCEGDQFSEAYKDIAGVGVGSATSFFEAYTHVSGESFPGGSNDLLGVAYIRAIIRNKLNIDPIAIKREGSAYNDGELTSESGYPSALMIRNALGDGLGKIEKCLPEKAYEILADCVSSGKAPCDIKKIESAVLAFFRLADPETLAKANIAEAGGGLAERICKFARIARSYDELVSITSGKNYTRSRVRRAILSLMTGATEEDVRRAPAYTTVLGFNGAGRELLAAQRKRDDGEIAFVTKPADAPALSESAARQFYLSERADALFTLAKPSPSENGEYLLRSPEIM